MKAYTRFSFGDFELDERTYQLLKAGAPQPLEPKALDVLRLLVEHAPQLVGKAEIFSSVWKEVAVTDNALTRVVAQLRRALNDDPKEPRFIETVATRGYRFVAPVAVLPAETQGAEPPPSHASAPPALAAAPLPDLRSSDKKRRRWRVLVPVAAVLILGAVWVRATWSPTGAARVSRPVLPDPAVLALAKPVQLTAAKGFDGFASFSPDGHSVAFSSDKSGALEIYVSGIAPGSATTQLTNNGRQNVQSAWSPDGQFIAYHEMAGDGIWVMPSRGGVARRVADFGSHPSWSPDGRRLAFQSWPLTEVNSVGIGGIVSTIWMVDSDGQQPPTRLTRAGEPPGPHALPAWLPDGRRILFAVGSTPSEVPWSRQILWTVDMATRHVEPLSDAPTLNGDLAISPDGRGLIFAALGPPGIWSLKFLEDGKAARDPIPSGIATVGAFIEQIALSPDGRRLGWTAVDFQNDLWEVGIDGKSGEPQGEPEALTDESGARAGIPAVLHTGAVAYVGTRQTNYSSIYLMSPEGTVRQLTTHPPHHGGPFWLPGEKEIGFVTSHGEGPGFWAVNLETLRERQLFPLSAIPAPPDTEPFNAAASIGTSFQSDMSRLATTFVRKGVPNIWAIRIGKSGPIGPAVQVSFEKEGGSYPSWSPDGRWVAYQCTDGGNTHVCVVSADGRERNQLTHEPGQSWVRGWSPDGDKVLFAARRGLTWNVAWVSRSSGTTRMLTKFTKPNNYVRYPVWDAARSRVIFERNETLGRIWSIELPPTP